MTADLDDTQGTGVSFVLGGREYRADDLTLNDVAEIEDEYGDNIMDLVSGGRMRPMLHMAWCIRRHTEPDLKLEDVGAVTLGALVAEANEASGPPTEAPAESRKPASGGSRGSRGSTASARGKSGS